MATNYERGRAAENYIKRKLERAGFVVLRCAASKPVDLVAFKGGKAVWIEVKKSNKKVGEKEIELAKKAGVKLVLIRKKGKRYEAEVLYEPKRVKVVKPEKPEGTVRKGAKEKSFWPFWEHKRRPRPIWDMIFG